MADNHSVRKIARGTSAAVSRYTGPAGELVMNTTSNDLYLQTGVQGGVKMAKDNLVVHNTGNETISGSKTFASPVSIASATSAGHAVRYDQVSTIASSAASSAAASITNVASAGYATSAGTAGSTTSATSAGFAAKIGTASTNIGGVTTPVYVANGTVTSCNITSMTSAFAANMPNTGVTAGSYGPTANASVGNSTSFTVPQITVDAKGRVTSATTRTFTTNISAGGSAYTLPVATSSVLGGVKVGSNLSITNAGELSAVIPTAASNTLGGVKVGNHLTISSGVLSAAYTASDGIALSGSNFSADTNVVTTAPTAGVTLYLNASSGNDNNNGRASNSAFKTFDRMYAEVCRLTCPVTVYITGGTYIAPSMYLIGGCPNLTLTLLGNVIINFSTASSASWGSNRGNVTLNLQGHTLTVNGKLACVEGELYISSLADDGTTVVSGATLTAQRIEFTNRSRTQIVNATVNVTGGTDGRNTTNTAAFIIERNTTCIIVCSLTVAGDININLHSDFYINRGSTINVNAINAKAQARVATQAMGSSTAPINITIKQLQATLNSAISIGDSGSTNTYGSLTINGQSGEVLILAQTLSTIGIYCPLTCVANTSSNIIYCYVHSFVSISGTYAFNVSGSLSTSNASHCSVFIQRFSVVQIDATKRTITTTLTGKKYALDQNSLLWTGKASSAADYVPGKTAGTIGTSGSNTLM